MTDGLNVGDCVGVGVEGVVVGVLEGVFDGSKEILGLLDTVGGFVGAYVTSLDVGWSDNDGPSLGIDDG